MLRKASTMVWRASRWLSRWMPLAILACFCIAATLFITRFGARLRHAEHWSLVLMALAAACAVGALRRARGQPMWPELLDRRHRPASAFIAACLAGLIGLKFITFLVRAAAGEADLVTRGEPAFSLLQFLSSVIVFGFPLLLIAASIAAFTRLLRAAGHGSLLLTSIIGVGVALLNSSQLTFLARVPSDEPYVRATIGVLIGLTMATSFWMMGGVARTASPERARQPIARPPLASRMSPAAWAGFRRVIFLVLAITTGVILVFPYPYGVVLIVALFAEAPRYAWVLLDIFIIAAVGAEAAKRFRDRDILAYAYGKRVGTCAILLSVNAIYAQPHLAWTLVDLVIRRL